MACDHNTITNVILENKHALVHCDGVFIMSELTSNQTTSAHEIEVFDTAQEALDRELELGITISPDNLIRYMEKGATLPQALLDNLESEVPGLDISYSIRMEALGL